MNKKDTNLLCLSHCLITQELHNALWEELKMKEDSKADYTFSVLIFRVLNHDGNKIIYHSSTYHQLLVKPFLFYLIERNKYNSYKEPGYLLNLIGCDFIETVAWEDRDINAQGQNDFVNNAFETIYDNAQRKSLQVKYRLSSIYKIINRMTHICDQTDLVELLKLAYMKDYRGFLKKLLDGYEVKDSLLESIGAEDDLVLNILNGCVFVVRNESKFIEGVRSIGYKNVNRGIQACRGELDELHLYSSLLNVDFRKSLYNHYNYHYNRTAFYENRLDRNKFTYNNINKNLSGARMYSTFKTNQSDVKQSKEFLTSSIFKHLRIFLDNNPLNANTQKKLESYILSQYNWWESIKPSYSVLDINMDIFTSKFNNFFLEKREVICSYLDKVKQKNKSISKLKSKDILSSKNNMFYLNKIINKLENDKILDLILYNLFKLVTYNNSDYKNINELTCAIDFGKNICREYLVILYKQSLTSDKNIQFSVWKTQNEDIVQPFEDNSVLFDFIGTRLFVELLIQADLVYEEIIINKEEKNKQFKILSLSKEVLQIVDNKKIYVVPLKLPMIVEPKPYTPNQLGGYLLNDVEKTEKLLIDKPNYKEDSVIVEDNIIYDMTNHLNQTSYKINNEVLDFIHEYGVEYGLIEDVKEIHPLENIKRNKRQDKIYRAYKSKIILEQNILGIADTFANMSIYFPVRLDKRGRVYSEPLYFNYQSNELAKSLISFTFPGIINRKDSNAIGYLKAYGANRFGHGLDKKSYSKKIEWVDNNLADIIDYNNGKLLTKAEDKCLFLSFCMEYTRFTEFLEQDDIEFQTYLPIELDATCNGFQHLALLSTETNIFKELNISKASRKDDPKDFYSYMKNSLNFIFKENSNNEKLSDLDRLSYKRLNAFPWDRKNIKQAIMTLPYNASLRSIIKYIKDTVNICELNEEEFEIYKENEKIRKENEKIRKQSAKLRKDKRIKKITPIMRWFGLVDQVTPKRMINDRDIDLLGKAINDIIDKDFPKITKLSDYLINVAGICNSLSIPISWGLPNGLRINQSYLFTKTATIKPFTFIKSSFKLKVAVNTKFDLSKQKIALMPNLIHSLDATSLSLLYDRFYEVHKPIVNFYAIHDCFATTCDKVGSLIDLLKTVYLSLYTEDNYLRKFDKGIIDSIIYHYGHECVYNSEKRTFTIGKKDYRLYDIEEVLGKNLPTNLTSDLIKGSQYLVI